MLEQLGRAVIASCCRTDYRDLETALTLSTACRARQFAALGVALSGDA
jgi:hypothetical protein